MTDDPIAKLANEFEKYITLERVVPARTYNYAARGFFGLAVIEHQMHGSKCSAGQEWAYIAVPATASLRQLSASERLYVGAQTSDRMFRGDGMSGNNFHHAEMRRGRGSDNLIEYLVNVGPVAIHRLPMHRMGVRASSDESLRQLFALPKSSRFHLGFWLEQLLLQRSGPWRWNAVGVTRSSADLLRRDGWS